MIDTIISALEALLAAIRAKGDRKHETFDVVIAPLYKDLTTIHGDYLDLFEKCRTALAEGTSVASLSNDFMADRLEMEALRSSVAEIAYSLAADKTMRQYKTFFEAVSAYFWGFPLVRRRTDSSGFLHMIEWVARTEKASRLAPTKVDGNDDRQMLIAELDGILDRLREKWKRLAGSYSKVLAKRASK